MSAPQDNSKLIVRRELLAREFLAALVLMVILMSLALALPAANIIEPENPVSCEIRAPWLIIWLQVLLRHFPSYIAGLFIPFAAFMIVASLPWLPDVDRHDQSKQYQFTLHQIVLLAMAFAIIFLTFWGL
jgi:quinol-cytochrome oxidoreductase complex cytochrome b subunit